MKILSSNLSEISAHKYLRCDYKYWNKTRKVNFTQYLLLKDVFTIIKGTVQTEHYSLDKTAVPYIRISDIELKFGIDLSDTVYLDEDAAIPEEKILKKDDLILAVIGSVGKMALAEHVQGGTHSNNTVVLRAKNSDINMKFYEKLFQSNYYISYLLGVVSQKAQPNLQLYDLKNIKLPVIDNSLILSTVTRISPIEKQISALKGNIKDIQGIVDEVLIKYYHINFELLSSINSMQQMDITLTEMLNNNKGFRTSFRFNKALLIQDFLEENISPFLKLGQYIISTKNGWSPQCYEDELKYKVLGIDAVRKNTKLSFSNLKFTNEEIANMNDYFIKDGDFFVSRGNTTDLVALASIADKEEILENTIYPDLMIKVEFDGRINKQYMAYIFNSFIGRLYFKYATKGKNQTMVKVSERELLEFRVPIPNLCEQQRIVDEIQAEIDKQNEIKNQIAILRMEIDKIGESAAGLSEN